VNQARMRAERRADKRSEIIISSIHPTIGIKDRSMPTSAGGSEITREIARITRARSRRSSLFEVKTLYALFIPSMAPTSSTTIANRAR